MYTVTTDNGRLFTKQSMKHVEKLSASLDIESRGKSREADLPVLSPDTKHPHASAQVPGTVQHCKSHIGRLALVSSRHTHSLTHPCILEFLHASIYEYPSALPFQRHAQLGASMVLRLNLGHHR